MLRYCLWKMRCAQAANLAFLGVQIPHMAAKTLVMLGLGNEEVNRRVQHTVLVPLMSQVRLLSSRSAAACSLIQH